MNYLEEYDETDPISIETYAKRLIGKTFADVCRQDDITKAMVVRETANYEVKHENKSNIYFIFHYQKEISYDCHTKYENYILYLTRFFLSSTKNFHTDS